MKQVFLPFKVFKFVFSSLTPLAVVFSVLVVISSSLIIYDQIQTHKERQLGGQLSKNLKSESACSAIARAGEKFDFTFTFTNENGVPIPIETIWVDRSLLGSGEKKFTGLIESKPTVSKAEMKNFRQSYSFKDVGADAKSKLSIVLTFQAADRKEAGANPHTIVIYKGKMLFDFAHEIKIEAPCEIQVRYS